MSEEAAILPSPVVQPLSDREFRNALRDIVPSLRSFARGLCGNRDLADDLVQEAMLRAWGARDRFAAGSNFRAWMYKILRNQFYSTLRRGRRFVDCEAEFGERALVDHGGQEDAVLVAEVAAALQKLSPSHREVLMLVGANGLEYNEAAEILGCAVGTVKSRVCRARKALAEQMFGAGATGLDASFAVREGMWDKTPMGAATTGW